MGITRDVQAELDGIWRETLRVERHDRLQRMILGFSSLLSGACLAIGLAHVYISLAALE